MGQPNQHWAAVPIENLEAESTIIETLTHADAKAMGIETQRAKKVVMVQESNESLIE